MQYQVPFFGNHTDDLHCFQASLKMVAKYFWPNEDYSWEELDKITAKKPDKWTWPLAGLLWLKSKGAEVVVKEIFDHQMFVDKGEEYLIDFFGKSVGQTQIDNSDIPQERELTKVALNKLKIVKELPSVDDIIDFLNNQYLVAANINSSALNNKPGYVGHFVVITGHDDNHLIIHDPGLPPFPNRKVTKDQFVNAWAYPNSSAQNLVAVKFYIDTSQAN